MTNDDYRLCSLLISFFTALGTISAVFVALHLANRDKKILLNIGADIFLFNNKEYLFIQIINNGYQIVYLKNILFRYGLFRKKYITINEKYIDFSHTTYKPLQKLEVGEIVTLSVSKEFLKDIYKELLISTFNIKQHTLDIVVTTTLRNAFKVKANRKIKNIMNNLV